MKTYLKYFAIPMLIAVIASVLYIIDALIGGLFIAWGLVYVGCICLMDNFLWGKVLR